MEAVGISCWWFASRDRDLEKTFDPTSHVAEIKRAPKSVENLSNLTIEADENFIAIPGDDENSEYNKFFPLFHSLYIGFDIFLPVRVQQKYNPLDFRLDAVENFCVKIICKRPMPVAHIHYTVAGGEADVNDFSPSTAAMIVRQYLEEKLRDNTKVDFQSLGPSPFHGDIFLDQSPQGGAIEAPKDLTKPGSGYRTLYFPTVAIKPNAQLAELVAKNHGTRRAFYTVIRRRNYAQRLARAVTDGSLELLRPPERTGRWATFQHWRGYRARVDEVFTALLNEKMNRVSQGQLALEIEEDETILRSGPLYHLLERTRDAAQMPDEDIRELLVMLEERRRGYFENVATLFSGLVGGVLGAALGAALTFGLADHSESKALKKDRDRRARWCTRGCRSPRLYVRTSARPARTPASLPMFRSRQ
ncbi:hypothetical protein SAMN05444169_7141 [Bradyrhizobium erythrophlei]|uniref:Uncharacterized protein n=1 Tax=Bradyrhizobium erythrophlei TaxID=1437360 RepID=A0A1M5SGU1_9BRAD|nr:hypothetical protein SAMN05444169_7141 [Bradyrhizobium erythrophlei]